MRIRYSQDKEQNPKKSNNQEELRPRVDEDQQVEFKPYRTNTAILIVGAFAVLLICTFAVGLIYYVARESLMNEIRHQLISIASTAALQIDPIKHAKLKSREDENTPEYKELKEVMHRIQIANPNIRFIYTMTRTDEPNIWQFIVDAEYNPAEVSHIGDKYDISKIPGILKAYSRPIADKEFNEDEWGIWLSGYAPIYDSNRQPIAVLGVDMTQEDVQRRLTLITIYSSIILLIFLTLVTLSAVLYYRWTRLLIVQRNLSYQLSLTDYLTQLANLRQLDLILDFELQVASRYNRPLALIMGDIDHFKKLNDTYGHLAGNNLLSKVAHLIKANVRIADLVARFGGEEFVIVMPNTDAIGAEIVAEKIRKVVEAESFLIPGKEIMPVTISFGVVAYPTEAKTKEELLGHADDALLAAKKAGRNRTKTYTSVVTMDSIGDIT